MKILMYLSKLGQNKVYQDLLNLFYYQIIIKVNDINSVFYS